MGLSLYVRRTFAALPITSNRGAFPATTLRLPVGLSCDISILPSPSLISTQDSPANSMRTRPSPPGAAGALGGGAALVAATAGFSGAATGGLTGNSASVGADAGANAGAEAGAGRDFASFCSAGLVDASFARGNV